jgi:hypothetical protein
VRRSEGHSVINWIDLRVCRLAVRPLAHSLLGQWLPNHSTASGDDAAGFPPEEVRGRDEHCSIECGHDHDVDPQGIPYAGLKAGVHQGPDSVDGLGQGIVPGRRRKRAGREERGEQGAAHEDEGQPYWTAHLIQKTESSPVAIAIDARKTAAFCQKSKFPA